MNFKVIRDVKPSDIIVDPKNIRLTYDVDKLAKGISQFGLINPPLVAKDRFGTYHCIDGNRRTTACQKLEKGFTVKTAGKLVTYELPSDFRVQLYDDELWEDLDPLKLIEIRISATDSQEVFTGISRGTIFVEWITTYAKNEFGMSYDVAKKNRFIWRKIIDAMLIRFPSTSLTQINHALAMIRMFGAAKDRDNMHNLLKDKIIGERVASELSKVSPSDQTKAIELAAKSRKDGITNTQIKKAIRLSRTNSNDSTGSFEALYNENITKAKTTTTLHLTDIPMWLYTVIKRLSTKKSVTLADIVVPVLSKEFEKYLEEFQEVKREVLSRAETLQDIDDGKLSEAIAPIIKEDRIIRESRKEK